jgi:phosphoribosyl-ATP pyrophosphohydrolase
MSEKVQVLVRLFETIINRSNDDPNNSYTAQLLSEGQEKCIAKLKEEALETLDAAENNDINQIIYESADLIYHLLVLWKKFEISPDQIYDELSSREGRTGIRK